MGRVNIKALIGIVFVLLAFLIMFFDAQLHIDFQSKPSMVFLHGAQHPAGGDEHEESSASVASGGPDR